MTHPLITTLTLLRVHSGLTQADVAESIGITKPAVSQIESGLRLPRGVETLVAFADAVGADVVIVPRRRLRTRPMQEARRARGISRRIHAAMLGPVQV